MAEYTPGPWVRDPHECGGVYSANGKRVFGGGYAGEVWWDGEADADYALVLAGPEMLEALKAMSGVFDTPIARRRMGGEYADEARNMARAALRKAEGAE